MTDISVRTETFTVEDRSWLDQQAFLLTRSITLDISAFTAGTHYPNGFLPSGLVIAKITASGLYGPYNNALSNGQEVAAGHLFNSVRVRAGASGPDIPAPLMWAGSVVEARLPAGHGLDAAGKIDLASWIKYW